MYDETNRKVNLALSAHDYDGGVWEAYDNARNHFLEEEKQLVANKASLPGIDACAMEAPGWDEKLIAGAETLRYLISEIYGCMPDDNWVRQRALSVRMTYELAHSLIYLAHAYRDVQIKRATWALNKLQSNFESKQKCPDFGLWTANECENMGIERTIGKIEDRLPALEARVWEEFKNAESQNS